MVESQFVMPRRVELERRRYLERKRDRDRDRGRLLMFSTFICACICVIRSLNTLMAVAKGSLAPTFCAGGLVTAVIQSALAATICPGSGSRREGSLM